MKCISTHPQIQFGCDPEFFFGTKNGIVGAEKVIPQEGITIASQDHLTTGKKGVNSHFVLDGVQVELNPRPHPCRANLGAEIAGCFRNLKIHLDKQKNINVVFDQVIKIDQKELDSLCDKAKVLGCAPSSNLYGNTEIKVNAATLQERSAGGHIHIGLPLEFRKPDLMKRLVQLMDVVVGNTCVLIDRNPANAERRKLYGKAGEYRLPSHGVEYRTLSNFWLRSYPLMSCVMGLTRLSTAILNVSLNSRYYEDWDATEDLLSRFKMDNVVKAINTNDFVLAEENYRGLEAFVKTYGPYTDNMAISNSNLGKFRKFFETVERKGIEEYFPENPLTHWCRLKDGHGAGFETFILTQV